MASFDSNSFSTSSFSILSFFFGDVADTQTGGGRAKKRLRKVFKEKGYFLEDEKYESDSALAYEVIAEIGYEEVTRDIQGAEVTLEAPLEPRREDISINVRDSGNIAVMSLRSDLEAQIEAKKDQVYKMLLGKYELEVQKIEEELLFMLTALLEDGF